MGADSQWAVQQAVYSALSNASALTSQLAAGDDSIFDHVPEDSAFPYITIFETTAQPFDTQVGNGMDMIIGIHSWSRYRGEKEIKNIMAAVYDALHDTALTITGHTHILTRFLNSQAVMDPDGLTRHGVQQFRIITEPSA